jgi:hypothetical protein
MVGGFLFETWPGLPLGAGSLACAGAIGLMAVFFRESEKQVVPARASAGP